MVRVRTYVIAKSLGSERAQAAMFSWIVDVCIVFRYLVLLGLTWISAPRLLQLEFTIVVYRTRDLFQVLPTPFVVISATRRYLAAHIT